MISPTDVPPSPKPLFKTFHIFFIYFLRCSSFQHHTKLCAKCSSSLVSTLNSSPNMLVKIFFFCHGDLGFNFTCTSSIILYHATQIFFNIPHSPVAFHLPCSVLTWDTRYLSFIHVHFHYIALTLKPNDGLNQSILYFCIYFVGYERKTEGKVSMYEIFCEFMLLLPSCLMTKHETADIHVSYSTNNSAVLETC